jgi:RHS repeat-associated protein
MRRLVKRGLSGHPVVGYVARTSKLVPAKSTATSDWYQNADGSYTRKIAAGPINYRDAAGHWRPIDTTLVKGAGGRWHEKANSLTVDLAPSAAAAALVHLGLRAGRAVSYGLAGAAPVRAVVSQSVATYPGVLPGTDLVVRPTAIGTQESLVLHSASAAHRWAFPLALTGLTPVIAENGSVDLVGSSGKTEAVFPAPYAYDSKISRRPAGPATTHAVRYQLATVAGQPVLVLTLNRAWLDSPARVFPVTVDPTLNLFPFSTYTESTAPGDHSTENLIKVGSSNSGPDSANSFLQFPGSGLDGSHVTVSAANLELFDTFASTCTPERFDVAPVTAPWTPSGVTSYPGPSRGASMGNATPTVTDACGNTSLNPAVGDWVKVPLSTSVVQGWANGSTADDGMAVYASTSDSLHWKEFGSVYDSYGMPYLQITYTGFVLPGVLSQTPANGYTAGTLTPQLTASGHVDPGDVGKMKFDFQIVNSGGTKVADSGLISGGSAEYGSAAWTVPSGKLKWGTDYYWTVQSYDGTNYSPGAVWNALRIDVPPPVVTSTLSQNSGSYGFDPSIGNYTTEATDAQVSTIGPPLKVVRDYNSRDPRIAGAFGASWSSVFDARATEQYDSTGAVASVVVTYPDGSGVGFGKNPDGTFSPPAGRFATFKAITGGYSLTDKNDTVYTFTQSLGSGVYGITSISDALKRAENFTWASGEITAMTSAVSGRALHLVWTTPGGATSPHVASVSTDQVSPSTPANKWTYNYTGDQLTSVCPPGTTTACTTYGYRQGSQYASEVLDEGPQSLWPLAETSGTTAVSAVLANEGNDNATYSSVSLGQPGPLAGSTATAAGFNGTSSLVALPNLGLYNQENETISLWFKTSAAPGVLMSAEDNPIQATATQGNFDPVLYIGSDGKLNGLIWPGITPSPIVSGSAVDDGNWHHVVLAGSYNAQTMWLDGTQVGTAPGAGSIGFAPATQPWILGHDYLGTGYLGSNWPDQPHPKSSTLYATYFNGSIADAAFFTRALAPSDSSALWSAGTHPASLLSSISLPSGKTQAGISYDPVTATVTQVTDQNGGVWQLAPPTVTGSSEVYRSSVMGAGPVGYWRLGEPSGALQAASEVNYTPGTYANVGLGVSGPFADETAGSFDGSSSSVTMPAGLVSGAGNQSVSLWFKATGAGPLFGNSATPLSAGSATSYTPELYVGTSGDLHGEFWKGSVGTPIATSSPVTDGQWHNVVLAAGTSSQSMYLDGRLVGTLTGTISGTGQPNVYAGAGYLGGNWPDEANNGHTGAPAYFSGSIGEVAFYNSQLTSDQVTGEYAAARNSYGLSPVMTVDVTDPGTHVITDEYDPLNGNRMVAMIDALGHKTTYGYDTSGFLNTVTDPNGDVTTTGHDVRGNMVSQTTCQDQAASKCSTVYYTYYPDDTSAQLSPDPRNDMPLTVSDGRSASASDTTYQTTYSYDSSGDLTGVTTPAVPGFPQGRTTTVTYSDGTSSYPAVGGGNEPAGLPVKVVSPGGATNQMFYYQNGDLAKTVNADGLTTNYTYDNLGRVTNRTEVSDTYPNGLTTSYTYDGQNRVLTETDPPVTDRVTGAIHKAQTTTVYDPDGNITSQTVADLSGGDASRAVSATYNQYNQVATSTDANNKTTSFWYDAYGNQVKEIDANGNEVDSSYDPNGHLLNQTLIGYTGDPVNPSPPVNLIESSRAYDPAGRLASLTDSMGNTTSYTYTDNGLLATAKRSNAAMTSQFVQESDSYDAAGNLIQKVTNNGATTTNYTVDAADRTTSIVLDPSGVDRTTSVSYTPDDHQATVTQTGAGGATRVMSSGYDPMGNMTSQSLYTDGAGHPVGWWQLNQASGTSVTDSSGTGNTANATSVTWSGGAGTFNGSSSDITTNGPVLNTAGSFSVSAWANVASDTTSYQGIAGQQSTAEDGFRLQYTGTGLWSFNRTTTDTATSPTLVSVNSTAAAQTGTWTHLVGTFDASTGTMTLYVNGVAQGTAADTTPFAASGPLGIGADQWKAKITDWFDGSIANVQVYPRVLSPAEVTTLFNAGRSGGTTASSSQLTTSWALDERGLPKSMTDPNGNVTAYAYDEAGNLAQTTYPTVSAETNGGTPVQVNPVATTGYNTFGQPAETEDPNGNITTTAYDADGNPVSRTQPNYTPPGSSTPITAVTVDKYDNIGQLLSTTDPLNNTTSYTYDQLGDVATQTAPNGGVTHMTYDTNGDRLSVTGPTGAVTQATYDYLSRPLTYTVLDRYPTATTNITTYSYAPSASNPDGAWLASSTTQHGMTTSYAYDNAGELTGVTDGAGNTTSYAYDFLGRRTATTLADGSATTVGYDQADNPVSQAQLSPSGTVLASRSATYDGDGNMLSATDARGNTTTFTYNAMGWLTQEIQPVSAAQSITTSFGYDAAGNRTRFTDGRGNNWITTYNTWNLPESQIEPTTSTYTTAADSTFTTAYDADARAVTQTLPGGVTITSGYDQMGNLTSQAGTGADAATASRTFGYDLAGNLTSAATAAAGSAPATSESFTYNDRNELLTASGTAGASSFSYNGDALMTSRTDAAGTTSYTYDNNDRLNKLTDAATGTALTYKYNQLNQVSQIKYGSTGDVRAFGYDGLHRLASDTLQTASGTTVASINYGYDPNGNLTSKTTTGFAGAAANTYSYDWANRLTSWSNGTTTTNYSYDASGNRTQIGASNFTYDARDELVTGAGKTYTYTARGTLVSRTSSSGTANFSFDAYGQQITASTKTYAYDALGRMVTDTPSGGSALTLSYSGTDNTPASDSLSTYTWDPSGGLIGIGVPGGPQSAGVLAFTDLHTDVVGNFTASASALSASTAYDPLGQPLTTSGTMAGKLGFQSGWTDAATGKVDMGSRWYAPVIGQFSSRDTTLVSPVPNSVAANPFAYVDDNPLTRTDPTGASWWGDAWHAATGWISRAWDAATSWVSHAWHDVTSWVSKAWDSTMSWVTRTIDSLVRTIEREIRIVEQEIRDLWAELQRITRPVVHTVTHYADDAYHHATHYVSTAYHEVARVGQAAASYVKHHAAAIASFAVGAAVFGVCEGVTAGIGTIGCAAVAGAVGGLVSYGMSCGSSVGGCSVTGALVSTAVGALGGAVGGALAGALGGKLAATALGDILPDLAQQGLVGAAAGAAAGGATGAASYGLTCDSSAQGCSVSGLASATVSGAVAGAVVGGVLGAAGGLAAGCGGMSFTPRTKVVLASGRAVPIAALKRGDKVLATNTKTGKTQAEPVTAVLVHHDTNLYNLTIRTSRGTAVIDTTRNHLFWDRSVHRWVKAAALKHGTFLSTASSGPAVVSMGHNALTRSGWMWDLTVTPDHDFYVAAASATVLVHNSDCQGGSAPDQGLARPGALRDAALRVHALATPEQRFNMSTVALAEVAVPGEGSEYYASASSGRMSDEQIARLKELGVPEANIIPGREHAEMNILNSLLPANSSVVRWGIAWGQSDRPDPCPACKPYVNGTIEGWSHDR